LHSQLRLSIISLLVSVKEAEFTYLREKTGGTAGNISVQVSKLEEAGYVNVKKEFKNNYPCTTVSISKMGIKAFEDYVNNLKEYINVKK
jgi:DNA-binding MarR family transcriptional regulator